MRLIKIDAPAGRGAIVIQTAFDAGIERATLQAGKNWNADGRRENWRADGRRENRDGVELSTSTPKAKRFIDALAAAEFFDPQSFSSPSASLRRRSRKSRTPKSRAAPAAIECYADINRKRRNLRARTAREGERARHRQ